MNENKLCPTFSNQLISPLSLLRIFSNSNFQTCFICQEKYGTTKSTFSYSRINPEKFWKVLLVFYVNLHTKADLQQSCKKTFPVIFAGLREKNVPQAQSEIYFLSRELGKYTNNLFDYHFSEIDVVWVLREKVLIRANAILTKWNPENDE